MSYSFNPQEYGFEPIGRFPELQHLFGKTTYVRITCVGGDEFQPAGRTVYWYHACYNIGMGNDERWKIMSGAWDSNSPRDVPGHLSSDGHSIIHTDYAGLISTHEFAVILLKHILGTTRNDSVETDGKERLENPIKRNTILQPNLENVPGTGEMMDGDY